ncbi:MAG: peptidylprolyl isomerase [Lachnospiraceae bacterium]|nr:peptidylprolyl isomerase [Lachnospiraceae bacterium]
MSERVLAVSAGHEITEKELNELIANYPPEQQIYLSSPQAKDELLEQLIGFHLFSKMAEVEKIKETDEYKKTLAKMENELASHMAATSVIEKVTLEDAEVKAYYEENADQFVTDAQVKAKHILVDDEKTAEDIAKEIADGKSFEDAAKEYSTCPSKEKGGDLGFFGKGQMVPEFEKAAFEGEIGKVIGPVKTQFGAHLILVEEKKEEQKMPFEQIEAQLYNQLLQQKKQTAYADTVKELEAKFGVERKNGV